MRYLQRIIQLVPRMVLLQLVGITLASTVTLADSEVVWGATTTPHVVVIRTFHRRFLRNRPRNETSTTGSSTTNHSNTNSSVVDVATKANNTNSTSEKSNNSSTGIANLVLETQKNSSDALDGVLAVNTSLTSDPGVYYYVHSPTEYDTISPSDSWMNVSTTIRPDMHDFHNSNNNDSSSMSNAIFPTWGQLFLYVVWSLTIIFCCIIPTIVWFRRKTQEEQELMNLSTTHAPVRVVPARGISATHTNHNNNPSTRSRLTLRQHLFINSPNWKKYLESTLSAAWKKTRMVVCKEHYCSNDERGTKKTLLIKNQHNRKVCTSTKNTSPTAPGSPFKAVFAAASRNANASTTKTITPPATPAKGPSSATPTPTPKITYHKLSNNRESSSTSSSSSNGSDITVITTSSRPTIISTANDSFDDDSIMSMDGEDISSVGSKSGLFLRIPAADNTATSTKSRRRSTTRKIPNFCAICLDSYEVGNTIVWSSTNSSCVHAFHEHCIAAWCFRKIEEQFTPRTAVPCPCCRQSFVDLYLDFDAAMNSSVDSNSTTASNYDRNRNNNNNNQEAYPTGREEAIPSTSITAVVTPTNSTRNPRATTQEEEIAFEI